MTESTISYTAVQLNQPVADTPVLLHRKLNPAADSATLSVFSDDWWNLTPGLFESHVPTTRLNFTPVPEPFRHAVKHYYWLLINHDAPRRLRNSRVARLALRTIAISQPRLTTFALWLHSHGIDRFTDVTAEHLERFLSDVQASDTTNGMKACILTEVLRFWSYRSALPELMRLAVAPPWDGEDPCDVLGVVTKSGENRTPRIHTDTIDMLLMWSLRFVDTFASDILKAFHEYVALWRYSPSVRNYQIRGGDRRRGVDPTEVTNYLARLRENGGCLPGRRRHDGSLEIHWSHLVRLFKTSEHVFWQDRPLRRLIEHSGLPLSDQILLKTPITATVDGHPWLSAPIAYDDARFMAERLRTACFVAIAYLSGMRTGEVLNLERGCVSNDPETGLWTINGRKFKTARDSEGEKIPEGEVRDDPWVVIEDTARAVTVLEQLHGHNLLFHKHIHPHVAYGAAPKIRVGTGRNAQHIADDIEGFIAWVNNYAVSSGRTHEQIPPDLDGRIAPSRFRRTLAWHIVRKPRGLIAGAIQYGHLHVQMTLGYSGSYDSGFPDEHAFEEWLLRLDQLAEDHQQLESGEHVSGPAASTYRQRVDAAHQKFAGRVLKGSRQARDMLANPLLQIFPGRAMTCVFDQTKALCQTRSAQGDPRVTPDQDDCRPTCHNIAYTDRDIDQLQTEAAGIREILDDSLAPSPRHQRAHAELERLEQIIHNHDHQKDGP